MKVDLSFLGAARAEHGEHAPRVSWHEVARLCEKAMGLFLVGASLAMIACGVVAAALWLTWQLAEILP